MNASRDQTENGTENASSNGNSDGRKSSAKNSALGRGDVLGSSIVCRCAAGVSPRSQVLALISSILVSVVSRLQCASDTNHCNRFHPTENFLLRHSLRCGFFTFSHAIAAVSSGAPSASPARSSVLMADKFNKQQAQPEMTRNYWMLFMLARFPSLLSAIALLRCHVCSTSHSLVWKSTFVYQIVTLFCTWPTLTCYGTYV